ncbi:MAG: DNA-directed RNA polymerase subunit alpha [Bifidobacteriaceae bacterium]|nr:DNA-directed RNA polymerase subunit alpha [Bifidobacteriaceae bacterium]
MLIAYNPTIKEEKISDTRSKFVITPLEPGFGHTIGNSIRRALLSTIPGAAISSIKFDKVYHEFSTIEGVKEDVTEIILNLKKVVVSSELDEPVIARIKKDGAGTVTAGDIVLPAGVKVYNKDHLIATLSKDAKFDLQMIIERGRGYVLADINKERIDEIGQIAIDSLYSPVEKVTIAVSDTRVGTHTDFDQLIVDVTTNSSITPADAIASATKTLQNILSIVSDLNKKSEAVELIPSNEPAPAPVNSIPVDDSDDFESIQSLNLSRGATNSLKSNGIETVDQLAKLTVLDLNQIKGIGATKVNEIIKVLEQRGITVG